MRILVTNDDGVHARGILTLAKELSLLGEVYLVAPDHERSGTGHSITVFDPLRVVNVEAPGVTKGWIVGGTPADCTKLAMARLIDGPVDMVVSGINHGPNLGTDVLYSGTVSAAAEGIIMGAPAIAVSLNSHDREADFEVAARFTRILIASLFEQSIAKNTLLNINIPALERDEIKGVRISKLGKRNYGNLFEERMDPRGNAYYWMGGGVVEEQQDADSDVFAIDAGYISITPIQLDLTNYDILDEYKKNGHQLGLLLEEI